MAGVLRRLGIRQSGGQQSHVTRRIRRHGISTAHFLGQGANRGPTHRGGPRKLTPQERLVKRLDGRRMQASKLRRSLIESGREFRCEECGLQNRWNGRPIVLEIDHRNNDWLDDRPENLAFLCPNCHSQKPRHDARQIHS